MSGIINSRMFGKLTGLEKILDEKYTPVQAGDLWSQLPVIEFHDNGPMITPDGNIICDKCGRMVQQNYLNTHIQSGACERRKQMAMTRAKATCKNY